MKGRHEKGGQEEIEPQGAGQKTAGQGRCCQEAKPEDAEHDQVDARRALLPGAVIETEIIDEGG